MQVNGRAIKRTAVNLCLLLVSGAAGLSLCEGSLRLFYPKYRDLAETQFARNAMRIWAYTPNSRYRRYHPDLRLPHAVHHNNLALRQHRNFSERDLNSAVNIGFFGDSFVENVFMEAPYSFTEPLDYLLNQSGKRFNVLNFGIDSYGPGQSLLHYESFRHAQKLDYVFFVYCDNDLADLYGNQLFHLDDAGRLVRNEARPSPWWVPLMSQLHLPYLLLDARGRLSSSIKEMSLKKDRKRDKHRRRWIWKLFYSAGWESSEEGKFSLAVFRQLIRRWKQLVERNGSAFYVVTLPDRPVNRHLSSLLAEEGIKVIDLYDCFSTHDKEHHQRQWLASPYRFRVDLHWNEAGNQLAAVCLYRFLEKDARLPVLSKERLRAAIQQYYAAFGGWRPGNTGEGGDKIVVSPQMTVDIRRKYTALERSDSQEKRLRHLVVIPDKRMIDALFDVYFGEGYLIYVKEGRCPTEPEAPFFLHVIPTERKDLLPGREQYGFNSHDFSWEGVERATSCWVLRRLPSYPIRHIRTGQYVKDAQGNYVHLWEGEFSMDQGVGVEEGRD